MQSAQDWIPQKSQDEHNARHVAVTQPCGDHTQSHSTNSPEPFQHKSTLLSPGRWDVLVGRGEADRTQLQ